METSVVNPAFDQYQYKVFHKNKNKEIRGTGY